MVVVTKSGVEVGGGWGVGTYGDDEEVFFFFKQKTAYEIGQ